MIDEDSGSEIVCPYCGEDGECTHLIALIDLSYGEFLGGFMYERQEELEGLVKRIALDCLAARARGAASVGSVPEWLISELDELWPDHESQDTADPNLDDLDLDNDVYLRVLGEILAGGDVDWFKGVEDGGFPGSASAMVAYYGQSAKACFARIVEMLEGWAATNAPPAPLPRTPRPSHLRE